MRYGYLVLALIACRRDRSERPIPPPAVYIQRTAPVIGERFTYVVDDELRFVLGDATRTLDVSERTTAEIEETITAVRGEVVTARTLRVVAFAHQPLGADAPLAAPVVGKTYALPLDASIQGTERAAIEAIARRDTGEPDLATYLFTNRDFTRGVPWEIPRDHPAPFARGVHERAQITLTEVEGMNARFAVTQEIVVEPAGQRVPITLTGSVVVDIGRARVVAIAVEGHIREPAGTVREAHVVSRHAFEYPR